MTAKSDRFERQIERIQSLLEGENSIVTWDDRIPDPDNPSQPRQIDVSIRRDNALTIVECRIHADPQDVTWVEELIGRRISMKADAVIAASASGFTVGAIRKAKAHGVILRDMKSLTEDEIRTWGKRTHVSVDLHRFDNVGMRFIFSDTDINAVSPEDVEAAIQRQELGLAPIFDKIVDALRENDPDFAPAAIRIRVTPKELFVRGRIVVGIDLHAECQYERRELSLPTVVAYDAPGADTLERNAYVEIVEQDRFEITQSSDTVSVAIDVSSIERPPGTKLGRMHLHFTRPVEIREFALLGDADPGFSLNMLELGIDFESTR